MSLVEQNNSKKERIDKKIIKLEFEDTSSNEYKMVAI